ncbi:MAG: response regulator transcription factor [Firmicutes bacterium]|nr:response regulator transcription factor [Bacillota bacterium]
MEAYITLLYGAAIITGSAALVINIFAAKKGMQFSTEWIGSRSFTFFIAVLVMLNTTDFLIDFFFKGELYKPLFIIWVIAAALWPWSYYGMIELTRTAAGQLGKSRWICFFIALEAVIIIMEITDTIKPEGMSQAVYSGVNIAAYALSGIITVICCYKNISKIRSKNPVSSGDLSVYCVVFMLLTVVYIADEVMSIRMIEYPAVLDVIYIAGWLFIGIYSIIVICRGVYAEHKVKNGGETDTEASIKKFCSIYGLTDRETEIVKAIYEGKRITQIAENLGLSENTIRVHSSRLYKKLDVEDRVQAANKIREELNK